MAKIFLSYRRQDGVASGARSLIYQKLQDHYGKKSVFMDVERMQVARDFRDSLKDELKNTDVVLVLIGPDWTKLMEERGEEDTDFVRIEVETAFALNKPVVPLLLAGAKMPEAGQVPDSIKDLTYTHGIELDTGRYFNEGMVKLCADLDEHIFKGHISRQSLNKGAVFGGAGVIAVIFIALITYIFSGGASSEDITKTRVAAENISRHTEGMEQSLGEIAASFKSLKNTGIIANPSSSNEFYHNARIYELNGDYSNARKAYLGYFKFKEDKLDPHLRFIKLLKVQEGLEGARETYNYIAKQFPSDTRAVQLTQSLLYKRDTRLPKLQDFAKAYTDYAPVYHFLAKEYSSERLGARSISDMRTQKEYLSTFEKLDSEGKLVRYFVDQDEVIDWRKEAKVALKELESQMASSVLENPMQLTWMKHNAGWNGTVTIAEPITSLSWKTKEMSDYKVQPMSSNIDMRTGKPMPLSFFSLPVKQKETDIYVKYTDRNGSEHGPFAFKFKPTSQSWDNDIKILQMITTSWGSFREYNGKLLLYFTTVLSYRGAIQTITYGLDKDTPDTNYDFPAWDKPGTAQITAEVTPYIAVPKTTQYVTIQLMYKNGQKSEVVRIDR